MKKFYHMRTMLLLAASVFCCSTAWADTETELTATGGASKDTEVVGESYTIPATHIAGKGSAQAGEMTSKGFKIRTKNDGARLVFKVNSPYAIQKLVVEAIGNYKADDATKPYVTVSSVIVDGQTVQYAGGEFPEKEAGISGNLTIDNIEARDAIEIYFDNSNASAGTQINACWEVTYDAPQASEPTITIDPDTLHLIPGATFQLTGKVVPGSFADQVIWYTGSIEDFMEGRTSEIASVSEDGVVTALAAGQEAVKLTWEGNPGTNEDTCIVIVSDFDTEKYGIIKQHDFTTMGDVTLTTVSASTGYVWNDANSQCNLVYRCSNDGLEDLHFQAVISDGNAKGWQIVDGKGLNLTGAGRCAAIDGLKAGQFVEIVYTGGYLASKDRTVVDKYSHADLGAQKDLINEETGKVMFLIKEDSENEDLTYSGNGFLGFEIKSGNYITSITVYGEGGYNAIRDINAVPATDHPVYNLQGVQVGQTGKGIYISNGKKFVVR